MRELVSTVDTQSEDPPDIDKEDEGEGEDEDEEEEEDSGKMAVGYRPTTGLYVGRPKKPDTLKGKDESGDSLTAHHLFPWNKLRSDLNAALADSTGAKMGKVLDFAQYKAPAGFYEELAKAPSLRDGAFTGWVNEAARALCWGPANIFMGPLNNKRGDDPGEKVDVARMKSGVMTPASAVADLLTQQGGIAKATKLTELLARNVREAQVNDSGEVVARPYDPQDWEAGTGHKRVQRKGVKIKEGGGNISIDEDESSGWTKATKTTSGKTKTPKVTTPKLSDEDILRLREEAEQRRIEKEKEKDSSEDSTDEDSSLGGLFLDEQEVED